MNLGRAGIFDALNALVTAIVSGESLGCIAFGGEGP